MRNDEILSNIIGFGIFTTIAWFMCEPNMNIWFLYGGWILGTLVRVFFKE